MTTTVYPVPGACCDRCRGTEHLIEGDGPTVCRLCVSLLTETAADPYTASPKLRGWLQELHSDIVQLVEQGHGAVEWVWSPDWPAPR